MSIADEARRRAEVLIGLGRPTEAVPLLRQALSSGPGDADTWLTLARAELACAHAREALEAATRGVVLAPGREFGHRLASHAFSELCWHADAVSAAREAVRLAPNAWQTHARLARALAEPRTWEGNAPLGSTLVSKVHPRRRAAWHSVRRALALAPDHPDVHVAVGDVAMMTGAPAVARQMYQQALAVAPEHGDALYGLATLDTARGRVGSAVAGFSAGLATTAGAQSNEQLTMLHNTWRLRRLVGVLGSWTGGGLLLGSGLWLATHRDDSASWPQVLMAYGAIMLLGFGAMYLHWRRRIPAHLRPLMRGLPSGSATLSGCLEMVGLTVLIICAVAAPLLVLVIFGIVVAVQSFRTRLARRRGQPDGRASART